MFRTARALATVTATVIAAVVLLVVSALPAWAADAITLTWVRHAESAANAGGIIDTGVPGPGLTALGQTQAVAIAAGLGANQYDGVYVSSMIRTHETAGPLAADLSIAPVEYAGLREISAGILEGQSADDGLGRIGYILAPLAWALGARFAAVPGAENGNQFDARVDGAIQQIYDGGVVNPVLFSHGATIMIWTMMNVDNPDPLLILDHPLGNTAVVVVTGNPEDGWTLTDWDGIAVDPDPSLGTKLFVNVRDLAVAPQTALYDVGQALRTGDIGTISAAVRDGVVHVVRATVDFGRAMVRDITDAVVGALPRSAAAPAPRTIPTVRAVRAVAGERSGAADDHSVASAPKSSAGTAHKGTGSSRRAARDARKAAA